MKYCKKCHHQLNDAQNFCSHCGTFNDDVVFCIKCGALVDKDKTFCHKCGTPLESTACNVCGRLVDKHLNDTHHFCNNGQKYCPNCGEKMDVTENICPNCKTTVFANPCTECKLKYGERAFDNINYPGKAQHSHGKQGGSSVSKIVNFIIRVLLAITIVWVLISAGRYFVTAATVTSDQAMNALVALSPELATILESAEPAQILKIVQIWALVFGISSLIPLLWILPKRKKIISAMKGEITLSAGFKIGTLIFVNAIVGIILLCRKDL